MKVTALQTCSEPECGAKPSLRTVKKSRRDSERLVRFADMLTAMGTEPRLRIMQVLLTAHPEGMVVGDIQSEVEIAPSTLSHHLEKLKNEALVTVRRDKKFLWYTANPEVLEELLSFLFAECCSRTKTVKPETILKICR
jgi:ArsR family transcriptional regulator, arsenate/arsenite/antimonite-responsive transcriptional repressor